MILKELLERSEYTLVQGSEDVEISTLVYDSRKIEKGSVFVSAEQPLMVINL